MRLNDIFDSFSKRFTEEFENRFQKVARKGFIFFIFRFFFLFREINICFFNRFERFFIVLMDRWNNKDINRVAEQKNFDILILEMFEVWMSKKLCAA